MAVFCLGSIGNNAFCQSTKESSEKSEQIIIQKDKNSAGKTVIVIDTNVITVNGKPLNDYSGNVKVITREFRNGASGNTFSPRTNFIWNSGNRSGAFLGVLSQKSDKGAKITEVTKGSSAEKSGLQRGDVITKVNDKSVSGPDDLSDAINDFKPGDAVKISYLRNNKKKTQKVTLGKSQRAVTFNFNTDSLFRGRENFEFRTPQLRQFKNMPKDFLIYNSNQPKIGLRIQETEEGNGVKILNVEEGSAAEKAGLKKDDIVTEINGDKVNAVTQVLSQMNKPENKNNLKIKALRNNSELNFEIKIPKKLRSADL